MTHFSHRVGSQPRASAWMFWNVSTIKLHTCPGTLAPILTWLDSCPLPASFQGHCAFLPSDFLWQPKSTGLHSGQAGSAGKLTSTRSRTQPTSGSGWHLKIPAPMIHRGHESYTCFQSSLKGRGIELCLAVVVTDFLLSLITSSFSCRCFLGLCLK